MTWTSPTTFRTTLPHDFRTMSPATAGHAAGHSHGHGSTWMFGVISFRTVVAALTFFGLAGLAHRSAGLAEWSDHTSDCDLRPALRRCTAYISSCNRCIDCGTTVRRRSIARSVSGERCTFPSRRITRGWARSRFVRKDGSWNTPRGHAGRTSSRRARPCEVVEILSPMTVEVEPVDAVVPVVRDHVDHDRVEDDIA